MTQPMPTVAVRGESTQEVDPEIASFTVTVTARDRDRATTLSRLSHRVESLRTTLDGYRAAIEKRETSRLSVHAETTRRGEKVSAYVGSASTMVTVTDLDVLGEMMLRVADSDHVMVAGPYWSLRPASPVYRDARRAAIADALERAREYAAALGARVTGLLELTDPGLSGGPVTAQAPGGMMFSRGMAAPGGARELDLDPQRQQVYAQVEGRFTISEPTAVLDPVD